MYRPVSSAPHKITLTREAQERLDEAIRNYLLPEGELEPSVLQQLAAHPDEVQKNVIDRFLTTGLSYDVQNKTGWLVGILKRELKAFQEAARFRCLTPGVAKKLESALRTKRLRPEEFPSEVIEILSKCGTQEQHSVVDKFLQRHGTSSIQTPLAGAKGNGQHGPPVPFSTAREELYDIIRSLLGPHLLNCIDTAQFAYSYPQKAQKDSSRAFHRANLQQQLRLHDDVVEMLVTAGNAELFEKLLSVGNLPPNYLDADALWTMLSGTSVDEQMRILKELVAVHKADSTESDGSRFQIEKRREDFRVAVERVMTSYGFHGFGGRSHVPPMRGNIVDDGFTTKFDLSNLKIGETEWKQELSSTSKRKLKQFLRGKSPALSIDFQGSTVGERLGDHLQEFFSRHRPIMDVSLVSLNLVDTDIESDSAWNNLASFLLTSPARELELTSSSISSLALGVLVQTMADGEFPHCAPFYELPGIEPPRLAIFLSNNTSIRFPHNDEDWVKQWLAAGQMMIEPETIRQVQHIYSQLRGSARPEPWAEGLWNHSTEYSNGIYANGIHFSNADLPYKSQNSSSTETHYNQMDMPYTTDSDVHANSPGDEFKAYQGYPAYNRMGYAPYYGIDDSYSTWNPVLLNDKFLHPLPDLSRQFEQMSKDASPEVPTYDGDYSSPLRRDSYPMKAPPPAPPMNVAQYLHGSNANSSNGHSTSPTTDSGTEDHFSRWNHDGMRRNVKTTSPTAQFERMNKEIFALPSNRDEKLFTLPSYCGSRRLYPLKAPPPAPLSVSMYLGALNVHTTEEHAIPTAPIVVDARVSVAAPTKSEPNEKKAKNKIPKDFKIRICTAVI